MQCALEGEGDKISAGTKFKAGVQVAGNDVKLLPPLSLPLNSAHQAIIEAEKYAVLPTVCSTE